MPSGSYLKTLFILIFLVIFCPLAIDIYLPAFVNIAEYFNIANHQVQKTVSLFLLTVGLGQLFCGPLADKFGRKPIALAGIFLYIISSLMAFIAPDFDILLAARLLQGLAASATFVATFAIVRDKFDDNKSAQVITYLNGFVCFIPALAPILGAWLTVTFNWQANFLFLALFGVFGFLVVSLLFKETKPKKNQQAFSLLSLKQFKPMLRSRVFMFHSLICLFAMSVIIAFVTSAPQWLMSHLGLSQTQFTFWFTTNAAISIITSFIAPFFIKRSTKMTLIIGLSLLLLSGVLMASFEQVTVVNFMLPIFISSIGFSLCLGSAAGTALAPFSGQAGTASALIGLFQMSGAGLLVTLTQMLELSAPYLLVLHITLLAPLLFILLKDKKHKIHPVILHS